MVSLAPFYSVTVVPFYSAVRIRNTAIGLLRYLKLPNISRAVKYLDRRPEHITALVIV